MTGLVRITGAVLLRMIGLLRMAGGGLLRVTGRGGFLGTYSNLPAKSLTVSADFTGFSWWLRTP